MCGLESYVDDYKVFLSFSLPDVAQKAQQNKIASFSFLMHIEMLIFIFLFTQSAILCRFNKLKFANSNRQTLRTLDILGENHDSYLKQTRERITKENEEFHLLKEKIKSLNNVHSSHLSSLSTCCNCSGELSVLMKHAFESEKSSHPGSDIVFKLYFIIN